VFIWDGCVQIRGCLLEAGALWVIPGGGAMWKNLVCVCVCVCVCVVHLLGWECLLSVQVGEVCCFLRCVQCGVECSA